jgi:hypothetical protein
MMGRRIGGIICLVLAVGLCVAGMISLFRGDGPALTDPSGLGVSWAVGTFLPALVALIVGLWLLKK